MGDTIFIRNLEVWARVGVPDEERALPQKLRVSASFRGPDFKEAAAQDAMEASVDYAAVAERIKAVAAERPRQLLETLGEEIAAALLADFAIKRVEIDLLKFVLPDAEWVGVRLERKAKKRSKKVVPIVPREEVVPDHA